jgi:hypothetical protein
VRALAAVAGLVDPFGVFRARRFRRYDDGPAGLAPRRIFPPRPAG